MLNLLYCLSYKDHTLTHTYTHKQIQTFILIMVNKWKRLKKNARAKQCPYHTLTQSLKKCLRRDLKKFVVVHPPSLKKRALFSARALCCVASDKVKSATKKKQTKEKEKQVIANKTRKTIVLLIVEERNLHKHTHRKHKQQTELS
uniref:(northern house mosquito) hypothetical protein n=1 Tax=Culex pipiens TaxID=7175 RepID=A0A8D8F5N2_CULPI